MLYCTPFTVRIAVADLPSRLGRPRCDSGAVGACPAATLPVQAGILTLSRSPEVETPPHLEPNGRLDVPFDRDGPRDECGVFGVYAPGHDVARLAYFGLYALQHRGQESAGIATCEGGHITTLRELGLVSQVFDEEKLRALQGDMAIGHVRYSTTGGGAWENAQPVWRDDGRELALAHNGNLTNAVELYNELREAGVSSAAPRTPRSWPRCSPSAPARATTGSRTPSPR